MAGSLNKVWELGSRSVPRKKIERVIRERLEIGTEWVRGMHSRVTLNR